LGLAFQITDDILDVTGTTEAAELGKPVGSDEKNHKTTYVTLFTLEGAQKKADEASWPALWTCLAEFGEAAEPLREITRLMIGGEQVS
jgi:geranylgeranyl diphosphate synthase type II